MSRRGSSRSDPNQYEATNIDIEQLAHAFIDLILVRAAPTSSQHVQNANMSEACPASSWPTRVPHMTLKVRRELWLGADDTGLTAFLWVLVSVATPSLGRPPTRRKEASVNASEEGRSDSASGGVLKRNEVQKHALGRERGGVGHLRLGLCSCAGFPTSVSDSADSRYL
eukprot:3762176-Rhodomonas_salina.3